MKARHRRLAFILFTLVCFSAAAALILTNFRDQLVFFYSPTDIKTKSIPTDKIIRAGGLIKQGSVEKQGTSLHFVLTDTQNDLQVRYEGIAPPMFREGQGVVAEGTLQSGSFKAKTLLTKHDENYMPPEVAESLKQSGHWQSEKSYGN